MSSFLHRGDQLKSHALDIQQLVNPSCHVTVVNQEIWVQVHPQYLCSVLECLRSNMLFQYEHLYDILGLDLSRISRFPRGSSSTDINPTDDHLAVVYVIDSRRLHQRVYVTVALSQESLSLPSVSSIFTGAAWFEREVYDMYGIIFHQHPDLRRILTDYGFQGHPLRKDFPLSGYYEVRYDALEKRILSVPTKVESQTVECYNSLV